MPYCRQCHRVKPAAHFTDYPDHAASGPKVPLAQLHAARDAGDAGDAGDEGQRAGSGGALGAVLALGAVVVMLGGALFAAWWPIRNAGRG